MKENKSRITIRIFASASFLNDLGSDIIYPIWPHFVKNILGANMTILGILDGIGDALVSLSQAAAGYYSDKIRKRKIFIWIGYLMGATSRIGYALSTSWQMVLPFRILDRAGKIRSAPRDAIIADVSDETNRGKNFGILRTADNLGAVAGITICLVLVNFLSISTIFLIAAIPSFIAVLLIILSIKESSDSEKKIFKGIQLKQFDKNFRLFLIASGIFALGSFSYSFLMIFTQETGAKIYTLPIFYLIFTIAAALSSYPFGFIADKWGRKFTIGIGYLIWIIVCVGFIFSKSIFVFSILFLLYGLHKGALETVQKAFVSELGPNEYRASSLGGFQMIVGLCALPASSLAGILWDTIGKEATMIFSITLSIISSFMLMYIKEKKSDEGLSNNAGN